MTTGSLKGMTKVQREGELFRRFKAIGLVYVDLWQGQRYSTKTEYVLHFHALDQGTYAGEFRLEGVSGWGNHGVLDLDTLETVTRDQAVLRHACWATMVYRLRTHLGHQEAVRRIDGRLEAYGRNVARDLHLKLEPRVRGAQETPAARRALVATARREVAAAIRALDAITAEVARLCGPPPPRPISPREEAQGRRIFDEVYPAA